VHAALHMPLLTELEGIAVGDVAINMPLLAELENLWPPAARACVTSLPLDRRSAPETASSLRRETGPASLTRDG